MVCNYRIDKTLRIAYFSYTGDIRIEDIGSCFKRFLNDRDSMDCNRIVTNLTNADLSRITNEELERLVMSIEENRSRLKQISIAYVAPLDLQYGVMRVWLAIINDDLFKTARLFRSHEQALLWINGLEQTPSSRGKSQNEVKQVHSFF